MSKVIDMNIENSLSPQKGRLLISEPFLNDQYFKRSVILLCDYNDKEGAFGFVLNNYIDVQVEDVLKGFNGYEDRVSLGGPVKTENLYYLHRLGDEIEGSLHIVNDIYLSGNFNSLKEKLEQDRLNDEFIRFFVGYSGWAPTQLEQEIEQKSWIITDIEKSIDIMNTQNEELWELIMKSLGKKYEIMSNFPVDFHLN